MRKFKKTGFLKKRGFNIVSRFSLSAFFVISFFYITPILINFADKNFNNKEFTNNSKNILNYTLNNKDKSLEENSISENNEMDLLWDIIEENKSEIDLVRFDVKEVNYVFQQNNYNLKDARNSKLIKPVGIYLLPDDIRNISNTRERKEMFIKIVLPLILK